MRKLDVAMLWSQQLAKAYSSRLSDLLNSDEPSSDNPGRLWEHISHFMHSAAQDTIRLARPPPKNPWFDKEYRVANKKNTVAYRRSQQAPDLRAKSERYRKFTAFERQIKQRKKKLNGESVRKSRSRNNTRFTRRLPVCHKVKKLVYRTAGMNMDFW